MRRGFREEVARFYTRMMGRTLPIGLGCAYIGQAGDSDRQRGYQETLEQAYAAGFRYVDTAEMYGGSEFRVGRFLKTVPRDEVFVATKTRIPPALTPEEASVHVRQNLRNSLERLGVTQIDLYQLHDLSVLDQVFPAGGALDALREARAEGLIRYIGIGTRWHDILEQAANHPEFDAILTYLDYTLVDQSATLLIESVAAQGVGVVNGTPLANGLLVGKDPRTDTEMHPEVRRFRPHAVRLYDFAIERGVPLLALALHYPMRHPGISITLTGPADPEQLKATLAACAVEIDPAVWDDLNRLLHAPLPPASG
jgi:aryl-alcohol dehydrogenase-like predicted oxidoreductase